MWTTLSAMESYFPVIWVHPWVYRHGIVETSSSCTTKGCMQVSLRPSSLVRKGVYNWASATKGANWFPSLALWLADILRPVYSHFFPDWGPIPSYFLVPYTVEEGARYYFKCASFIQHMWCSCCCHIAIDIWYLLLNTFGWTEQFQYGSTRKIWGNAIKYLESTQECRNGGVVLKKKKHFTFNKLTVPNWRHRTLNKLIWMLKTRTVYQKDFMAC